MWTAKWAIPVRRIGLAVLVLALMAVTVQGGLAAPAALAQDVSAVAPVRSITVVGEGKVMIQPDTAQAQIGVDVLRPSVQEASAASNEIIDAVLAALQAQGIAEEDIQTSNFSIFAERYGPTGPLPEDEVQYRVSNNVAVTIRDLESVGAVLDAAIGAGANNIYGITFSLDDTSSIESEARKSAVENARAKAEELAMLSGVQLGEVLLLSEVIGGGGALYTGFAEQMAMGMGGGGTSVQPGQLELTMRLQVTYAIAGE